MSTEAVSPANNNRIASIDQLRGYAIFGMLAVNFLGHYKVKWIEVMDQSALKDWLMWIFKVQLEHHGEYMTYADIVAPMFMFVVGMGMRLSWTRRVDKLGAPATRKSMAKRFFILVLIGFAIYQGWLWDALMSIGLAGLVAVLVIDRKPAIRIAYALGLMVAYQLIFSLTDYGEWLLRMGSFGEEFPWPFITVFIPLRGDILDCAINGGLIGHWGWAVMLIAGSIAYDIMATCDQKKTMIGLLAMALICSVAGWSVKIIGTNAYRAKAEPFAATCMLEGDWGTAGQIIGNDPGIFTKMAKGNEAAEKALKSRDFRGFATAMDEPFQAMAQPELYKIYLQGSAGRKMLKEDWGRASGYLKKSPELFTSFAEGNEDALKALEAANAKDFADALGYSKVLAMSVLSKEAPRLRNEWVFSKNYVTIPFMLWASAIALFHLLAFFIICDVWKLSIPGMKVIGMNPFFIYIFQSLTLEMYANFNDHVPYKNTESMVLVLGSFVGYMLLVYLIALYFYKKKIIIKI